MQSSTHSSKHGKSTHILDLGNLKELLRVGAADTQSRALALAVLLLAAQADAMHLPFPAGVVVHLLRAVVVLAGHGDGGEEGHDGEEEDCVSHVGGNGLYCVGEWW